MRRLPRRATLVLALLLTAGLAWAFSTGPPEAKTGAPPIGAALAEGNCHECHGGHALNSGGAVQILGVPVLYRPDSSYLLTVQLGSAQTADSIGRKWGFELTAVREDEGTGVGDFTLADPNTQTKVGGFLASRTYVEHTSGGTRTNQSSPVTWEVEWKAPPAAVDRIFFFVAGNAANGNGDLLGDFIYTGSAFTDEDPTPVEATSWGSVKSRYRR